MRRFHAATLALGLMLPSAADAGSGWFKKDQYDPDTPGFLTPYARGQTGLGMHYTRGLFAEPTHRLSVTGTGELGFLVLPFVTVGTRATWSYLNARTEGPAGFDGYVGYRAFATTIDPVVAVDTLPLRVYGFASVLSLGRMKGLWGSGFPSEGLDYSHFGAGVALRVPMAAEAAIGPQIEYRQNRMSLRNGPSDHLPGSVVGHTLYFSIDFVGFGGFQ